MKHSKDNLHFYLHRLVFTDYPAVDAETRNSCYRWKFTINPWKYTTGVIRIPFITVYNYHPTTAIRETPPDTYTTPMSDLPKGVHFTLSPPKGTESIISTEAIEFLAVLHRTFDGRRKELLKNREKVQEDLDNVRVLTFVSLCSKPWRRRELEC